MRSIINGKKYDTETAKKVDSFWNGYPCSDFNYYTEELYLKKTGEFFIFGEGGPASPYAEYCGHARTSGKDIRPITLDEAKRWVENNCTIELYEELFGEVEE